MAAATTTSDTGTGRTAPSGRKWEKAVRGLWARHLWGWLTGTGYRPERHYMRGSRTNGTASLRPGLA